MTTNYTTDDFLHARFAAHPITGSVASKGRMDWKWVLPGWYDTGDVTRLSDQKMADAGWVPVRDSKNNQERNREALIDHIADQDSIIRRRNEQIARMGARADELARELADAVTRAERAEGDLARYRAMHSEQIRTIVRLQENPRALTTDEIEAVLHDILPLTTARLGDEDIAEIAFNLHAALTEPTRPEGAEKVEAVLHRYWSGDINGDDLADRIVEEMNR